MRSGLVLLTASLIAAVAAIGTAHAQMPTGKLCSGYYYPCTYDGCIVESGTCQDNRVDPPVVKNFDSYEISLRRQVGYCYPGSGACDDTVSQRACVCDFYTKAPMVDCSVVVCPSEIYKKGCPQT